MVEIKIEREFYKEDKKIQMSEKKPSLWFIISSITLPRWKIKYVFYVRKFDLV
jgi:hypothetical protein